MTTAAVAAARETHRRMAPWPYAELDIAGLRAGGWLPTPVQNVIMKVHQRCNLACDYCYVYTQADQSWRDRPSIMPPEVFTAAVQKLDRHVRTHGLTRVSVILHGGEPLLLGGDRLAELATELRAAIPSTCAVEIGMQTNGVLLSPAVVARLLEHRIKVGISVDGTAADHDRHRLFPSGKGSFHAVSKALELLARPENRDSYAGVLCTVSPQSDPAATYEQLKRFTPPAIDLLLPHANWEHPPARPAEGGTPFGDWLAAVFDLWFDDPDGMPVRLFDDIITMLMGGSGRSEQLGLSPAALLVIESDGAIELVDTLKSTYPGACATGLDIRRDEFDAAFDDPGYVARQIGLAALSSECLACPIHRVCGAGHFVHRFRPGAGFRHRSVYCEDLRHLVDHIHARVARDIQRLGAEAAEAA